MCFGLDSLPPVPVVRGAAVSHEDLVLDAADGTRLAAFAAVPETPSGNGIVILPDVRGLYRFYEELALRFAERGHAAVAIDYFGRTAGVGKRGDDFEFRPHVEQTTPEGVQADVHASVEWLRQDVRAFERALQAVGVEHEVVIYDGAPHSFFDRRYEEHAAASDDGWSKTLAFVEQYGM